MDKRADIRAKNPEMGLGDVSKELGVLWKDITTGDKEVYEKMALEDKERYTREVKEYERTGILPASATASKSSVKTSVSAPAAAPRPMKSDSHTTTHKIKSEEFIRDDEEDDF
jgi:structure-specific recognition protein 1